MSDMPHALPVSRIAPARVPRMTFALIIAIGFALSGCAGDIGDAFREAGNKIESLFEPQADLAVASRAPQEESDAPLKESGASQKESVAPQKVVPLDEAHYRAGLEARTRGDADLGFKSFEKAAKLGHAPASYEVSRAYAEGHGVAQNLDLAAEWTNLAAERGDARAQFLIGAAYYGGNGVPRDYEKAATFLTDSAVQGHAQAQYLLGEAYSNGRGVAQDDAWAARWYGKAATQGLGEAQYAYGVAHAAGLGVPKNPQTAYAWLHLAARAGHEDAKTAGPAVVAQLSAEQIENAVSWAKRFRPARSAGFADRATVTYVQHTLNGLGFDAGPVDGMPGPLTRTAVKSFQTKAGIAANGRISSKLVDRLRTAPQEQS